jgi:hypothetical protein
MPKSQQSWVRSRHLPHGNLGAADIAVLNTVHRKKNPKKSPCSHPCFQGPRALNEALGLDRAVAAAVALVDLKDTLILGICTVRNQTTKPLILGMHC